MFILYETTNLKNNKKYIGIHQTKTLEFDGYFGSGTALKNAVKLHGPNNFKRVTLDTFDNKEDAYQAESDVVDTDYVKRRDTYNLRVGGEGGYDHIHKSRKGNYKPTKEHLRKLHDSRRGKKNSKAHIEAIRKACTGSKHSEETKEKIRNARLGKKMSEETKKKIGEKSKGRVFEIVECPYCKKTGKANGMKGWHFEYCKQNPNRIERKKKKK